MEIKKLQNGLKFISWQKNFLHIERVVLYRSNEWKTRRLKKTHPQNETDFDYLDDNGETETGHPRGLTS